VGERILLVEGAADSLFYEVWCREPHRGVRTKPPKFFGGAVDSKTHAIHILPTIIKQLRDGSIERLGVVVDADYAASHGLGFSGTLQFVSTTLKAENFVGPTTSPSGSGFVFRHLDGLAPVGLWVMPDNSSDGMLEYFIKKAIVDPAQSALFQKAQQDVGRIVSPLFKTIHLSKAEVATWLAWQKMPGQGLAATVGGELIDTSTPLCAKFDSWLNAVFN